MQKKTISTLIAFSTVIGMVAQPAFAQPRRAEAYESGYSDGYREGYTDGRRRLRYDDTPPAYRPEIRPERSGYGDRDTRWRQQYQRTYSYQDDSFYRECRTNADPGGVIAGALIGGLLGNALGRGSGGTTVAGVIMGGVAGAALTRNLGCEDRSYAYKTYYDGFNSGREDVPYRWRNPNNGHYGELMVDDYDDRNGFRCANFTQRIFIEGRPQAGSGRACQQPDGTWAVVS